MRTSLRSNPPALAVAAPSVVVQESMVEIEISLPNPWVLRLQALASRLGRPESDVCFVLFLKGIRQGLTLVEYDAGCNFAVARQCDIDPRDGGESRS